MIGLYSYRTNNIGDDFQSYVLARYLGEKAAFVWRDGAANYKGEVTDLIVNGFVTREALPIHESVRPLFLAGWFDPMLLSDSDKVAFLSSHEPIGCRDTDSLERCRAAGLQSSFTGCPTILCEPIEEEVPGSILMVDVDPRLFQSGNPHYRVQTQIAGSVQWGTNVVDFTLSQEERVRECARRHRWMSRAELVITSRIHIALPALGMGKAVIFVQDHITIEGRLTALPPQVRQVLPDACPELSLDPEKHRYDIREYREHVKRTIEERCGHLRKDKMGNHIF
ncbi:MAG: hypothetical protein CMO55_17240 [Verrucomicrobiales bacterium]|nr:hypothetical protein [Verrucomicrobiales bacterium]